MTDAKGMFEFTIFLGVFYFLYIVTILGKEMISGTGAGIKEIPYFSRMVQIFFNPMQIEGAWKFLNLLIFLPIYIFLLFTAVDLAEKSVIGSHIVLTLLGVLFAGSFISLLLPPDFSLTEVIKSIPETLSGGASAIAGAIKEGLAKFFADTGTAITDKVSDLGHWIWDGIKGILPW